MGRSRGGLTSKIHAVVDTVKLDPADLTRSSIQLTIDTASINTRELQRDAHLRSADEVAGRLTMHGATRDIALTVESDGVGERSEGLDRRRAGAERLSPKAQALAASGIQAGGSGQASPELGGVRWTRTRRPPGSARTLRQTRPVTGSNTSRMIPALLIAS